MSKYNIIGYILVHTALKVDDALQAKRDQAYSDAGYPQIQFRLYPASVLRERIHAALSVFMTLSVLVFGSWGIFTWLFYETLNYVPGELWAAVTTVGPVLVLLILSFTGLAFIGASNRFIRRAHTTNARDTDAIEAFLTPQHLAGKMGVLLLSRSSITQLSPVAGSKAVKVSILVRPIYWFGLKTHTDYIFEFTSTTDQETFMTWREATV